MSHVALTPDGLAFIENDRVTDTLRRGEGQVAAIGSAVVWRHHIEESLGGDGPTEWMVCSLDAVRPDAYTVEVSTLDYGYALERLVLGEVGWTLHGCRS